MSRANNIQERLVNMDIMSKDLSTCVDEFEQAFFEDAKKQILEKMKEDSTRRAVQSDLQSISGTHLDQQGGGGSGEGTSISDSLDSSHRDNLPSSDAACLETKDDKDGSDDGDNHNTHGACDGTTIDPLFL
jgi:hypothetical protein